MSYTFVGPQGPNQKYGRNKGVMRERRLLKRKQAEERNALTAPENRRQYRLAHLDG